MDGPEKRFRQMKRWSRVILVGAVIGSCVGCDQVTKVVAHAHLAGRAPLSFLGGIVRLSYAENRGAFLSIGSGLPAGIRFWVFGMMVALVLALIAARAIADRRAGAVSVVGLAMIVGGGVGNLIDRVNAGVVRDFINIGIGSIRTGVFNVADLAITAGAVVVAFTWRVVGKADGPSNPI